MVRYTSKQRIFLYETYVTYGSARKCRRKFRGKFRFERVPSRQTIRNLVIKLRSTWPLIDKKQNHKLLLLTEEKLDDIRVIFERTSRKSLKRLAQEAWVSESSARRAAQLLKLRPCKTTAIHALQPRDRASRVHFCSWFLQSCHQWWDQCAVDILFWWSMVSLAGMHKYSK
jgi:hypothetical protein